MTTFFGLMHLSTSTTVLVRTSKEELEETIKTFRIFFVDKAYYHVLHKDTEKDRLPPFHAHVELNWAEFEIYELNKQQVSALDKEYCAKVDSTRIKRSSR